MRESDNGCLRVERRRWFQPMEKVDSLSSHEVEVYPCFASNAYQEA